MADIFKPRHTRTMIGATFTTAALIYHMTVYKLRRGQRNAIVGLLMSIMRMVIMVVVFLVMFHVIGLRSSPIRGDFIVYIMTGIFMFLCHMQALAAVSGAENAVSGLMKHEPLNTFIAIASSALMALYNQTLAVVVVLTGYSAWAGGVQIENPLACYGMLLLAWLSGCAVGLIFMAARPWWPQAISVIQLLYMRVNMIASGKMFVANAMPAYILNMFDWNPLFHIIDQTRGFAFINYTPRNSDLIYPIYVSLALLMIGLMIEFATRQNISISWGAGR
ncbi:MAG: ABC transporter permease [Paracoccus sp. (in: a-proteobacteria)]|nr:ABC transporter permease [Paracoccus sp. (in: a-proteobacteria)]